MKSTLKKVGHDLLVCLIWAVIGSAVTAAVGALLGLIMYDSAEVPIPALQGAVSGLLIVGSLAMLCSAFFFTRRSRKEDSSMGKFWKEKFRCFSYQAVFLSVSVIILLIGCALERVLFFLQ